MTSDQRRRELLSEKDERIAELEGQTADIREALAAWFHETTMSCAHLGDAHECVIRARNLMESGVLAAHPAPQTVDEAKEIVIGTCPDCGKTNEFPCPVTWPMTLECGVCGHASSTETWTWVLPDPPQWVRDRLNAIPKPPMTVTDAMVERAARAGCELLPGVDFDNLDTTDRDEAIRYHRAVLTAALTEGGAE